MSELVPVSLGECRCPDAPHGEDTAFLRPVLGLEGGFAVVGVLRRAADGGMSTEQAEQEIGIAYVVHGLADWTLSNGDGSKLPLDEATIRRGVAWSRIYPVADKAADLYGEEVFGPLVASRRRSSETGPTGSSTSARTRRSGTRRKP